jgi:tetratricopeptide (TPR) repeat protein
MLTEWREAEKLVEYALPGDNRLWLNFAGVYYEKGRLPEALTYYEKALIGAKAANNQMDLMRIYNGLSNIKTRQRNYDNAVEYANKLLSVAQEGEPVAEGLAKGNMRLAEVQLRRAEEDLGVRRFENQINIYLVQAREYTPENSMWGSELDYLEGWFHRTLGNIDLAEVLLKKAKSQAEENEIGYEFALDSRELAHIYFIRNDYDSLIELVAPIKEFFPSLEEAPDEVKQALEKIEGFIGILSSHDPAM